jgi:hypothetical protein
LDAPCISTNTLPGAAAVLYVTGTAIAELALPMFTKPKSTPCDATWP